MPPSDHRPRVVLVRGHQPNPWELRPWEQPPLCERFDIAYLRTRRGWFDTGSLTLPAVRALTLRDLLPPGRLGDLAVRVPGDRYLDLGSALTGADVVHSQELGYWYTAQAARLKRRLGYRLALTVWETLPFLGAYRNVRTRPYRELALEHTDVFLAATERARAALLLEGVGAERIRVCPPGIDVGRFAAEGSAGTERSARTATRAGRPQEPPLILSPGRLVWEKGHQDVLRALALLRRGVDGRPPRELRLCIVGSGPEERRLRAYARELGVADAVELRGFVPYEQMPALYARASCLVLASLPIWSWEEQFGMVLAEAMAAGLPLLASSSGAIPEVAGGAARYFVPGDWPGLARLLEQTLDGGAPAPGQPPHDYSTAAAAQRIAAVYEELLSSSR